MDLKTNFITEPTESSIICICTVYNEVDTIDFFIDYYINQKITHFIFIDNNSTDGTQERIQKKSENVNIKIYFTKDSYADNRFGMSWVNGIMHQYKEKWMLVVDCDEFIVLEDNKNLIDLKNSMIKTNSNVAEFILIDFYPGTDFKDSFKSDTINPFDHSKYYDLACDKNDYYITKAKDNCRVLKGGFRQRQFVEKSKANNHSFCLQKKSFFKFTFVRTHRLSVGMHWLFPRPFTGWHFKDWEKYNCYINYYEPINVIAHFKFVKRNFEEYLQKRIERNQDWNQSQQYKQYDFDVSSFYKHGKTIKYSNANKLYEDTIKRIINF